MTHRSATAVIGALVAALALGPLAGSARAQNPRDTTTMKKHKVPKTHADSVRDTSAYRSMDTTHMVMPGDSARDSTRDSTHFNRDSAQTAPRATTDKGLPGMIGAPAGTPKPADSTTQHDTSAATPRPK